MLYIKYLKQEMHRDFSENIRFYEEVAETGL